MPEGHMKAGVIDGANFAASCRDLGIQQISFVRLFNFLSQQIGRQNKLVCYSTIDPSLCNSGHQLFRDMVRAGIEPIPVTSQRSKDDTVVEQRLNTCCCNPQVCEVILISCDHALIKEALWLGELCGQRQWEKHIYVVATTANNRNGDSKVCRTLLTELDENPFTTFVELQGFVRKIAST